MTMRKLYSKRKLLHDWIIGFENFDCVLLGGNSNRIEIEISFNNTII
jgi:hypothetical protein